MISRSAPALLAGLGLAALAPAPAAADVDTTTSARSVARAIVAGQTALRGASWLKRPARGRFAAISSSRLVGFPRAGGTFAVLSTGRAADIDNPNAEADRSSDNGGAQWRGTRDTVVLRVDIDVPRGASCLSVSFRFLSEEFDEFIDTEFNDTFLVELGRSTWSATSGTLRAPRNFAFDRENRRISINSTGDFSVTDDRARGTTYDAGTRRLRASRAITPGRHSVFFTIFDRGDRQYDTSVVLDRLVANSRRPCVSGASLD